VSLTINDLHIHFEIYLSNRKGWQRKSDKGERDIHLRSASESILVVAIVRTSLHSPGNHYKIYPRPDMGRACDPFFWVLFWMNWVKYVHLGQAMGVGDFLFPAVGAGGVIQSGWPLSHDLVQKSIDAAVNGAKIPGKFSMHCFRCGGAVETHASLGAHIPISVHPSSFALLSTATRTQPARELSDAQLGTPDRVLRRSRMSGYSLPLPASIAITRNSFGSVWTSSRYSAQPPAPNPHESSPMRSLVHPIGSREGPA